ASPAELQTLRDEVSALALKVDEQAHQVQADLNTLSGHIGTVRRVYEAIRKANLQKLSALDRIRIEKTIRDLAVDPDEVFDEIERLAHACADRSNTLTEVASPHKETSRE
ncbi:MAG: hypothetical protein AAFS10_17165, partial [Myxococcota bacterium]